VQFSLATRAVVNASRLCGPTPATDDGGNSVGVLCVRDEEAGGEQEADEEGEDEEGPPPTPSQIAAKAISMLLLGTAICAFFSDPVVAAVGNFSKVGNHEPSPMSTMPSPPFLRHKGPSVPPPRRSVSPSEVQAELPIMPHLRAPPSCMRTALSASLHVRQCSWLALFPRSRSKRCYFVCSSDHACVSMHVVLLPAQCCSSSADVRRRRTMPWVSC
jgi:hypothetical protein